MQIFLASVLQPLVPTLLWLNTLQLTGQLADITFLIDATTTNPCLRALRRDDGPAAHRHLPQLAEGCPAAATARLRPRRRARRPSSKQKACQCKAEQLKAQALRSLVDGRHTSQVKQLVKHTRERPRRQK